MVKSKRAKVVHLTKTEKKGKENKANLVDKIRQAASTYQHVYLFRVQNMRNTFFKSLRMALDGRFFIGKNKIMALALGLDEASECRPGISCLARDLRGDLGLLFTNAVPEHVTKTFESYEEEDYARTGIQATMDVIIEADEAGLRNVETNELLPATLEPQLRQAGMPITLRGGIILLATTTSYTICNEGDQLTSNQARILKIFGIRMAAFQVHLFAHYHDSKYEEFDHERGCPITDNQRTAMTTLRTTKTKQ